MSFSLGRVNFNLLMAYTIANQNQSFFAKLKPILTYVVLFLVLGGIAYGVTVGMQEIPGIKQKAYLTVETVEAGAEVLFEDEVLGKTPLKTQEVSAGNHAVQIQSAENSNISYTAKPDFLPGVEVTLQRDLGVSDLFSSGRDFWMEKDRTNLTVISQPSGATVLVDGADVGATPLSLDKITEGDYELTIKSAGYETQSARISLKNGYKLNVSAKLFPVPVPSLIRKFEESNDLYDLTINDTLTAASTDRAKAVVYWNKTRGLEIEGTTTKEAFFDYFIDQTGNVYNAVGNLVTTPEELKTLAETAERGAYLGEDTQTPGLTPQARETYLNVFGSQKAEVLPTGVGWLRVRSAPGLGGSEVTKVNVGTMLTVLETQAGWIKVKTPSGQEGWVSADYVEIK